MCYYAMLLVDSFTEAWGTVTFDYEVGITAVGGVAVRGNLTAWADRGEGLGVGEE